MRLYRAVIVATTLAAFSAQVMAAEELATTELPVQKRMDISGDPEKPRRHYRIRDAARLDKVEAETIYEDLLPSLREGYAAGGNPTAQDYADWQRFNDAPYRSSTHGQRYVNNYANETASAYGRFEEAGKLPQGSVVAKDSFSVNQVGDVSAGPLFIMEKMDAGFNYVTGDWRYSVVMPDGSLVGETKGRDAERVEYCITCHLANERYDHLYFLPRDYRLAE